jgi:hypothetical protein
LVHPNAKTTWTTIRFSRDRTANQALIETVFVVETDLILNAESPEYKKDSVDELLAAVHKHFDENVKSIDRIEIIQV